MIKKLLALGVITSLHSCGPNASDSHQSDVDQRCLKDHPQTCNRDAHVARLTEEHQQAIRSNDQIRASQLQIELNYFSELHDLRPDDHYPTQVEALNSKYDVLRLIFADELDNYRAAGFVSDEQRVQHFREGFLAGPNFTASYHPRSLVEVKKVFNDFGELYVKEHKKTDGRAQFKAVQSEQRPWSGFWYPVTSRFLYAGDNAPLRKWDQVLRNRGIDSKIADREESRYSGYISEGWEGLCDGLSVASSTTVEPTKPKTIDGVTFSIADQKALYTYTHVKWPTKMYGIVYRGDASTDGTYQDIRPEAFHRLVTQVLGVEKRPVVIDDTAGVQVWNKPLFRYTWSIEQDPKLSYAYLVKGFPWLVKERQEETNRLTESKDILAPKYTFRLYVDKSQKKNGRFKVVAGQWTDKSYEDHPDTVTYPIKDGKPESHNPEFNKYLKEYNELFLGEKQ